MNWKSIDWKYIVTFVITLLGALVPVLWQSSQEARSISVKLLSSTTLQLGQQAGIKDLQVTLDGHNIDRPYLSLLEVVNSGSKPILSSEFETPIELFTKNEALIVTAQVIDTVPAGITAKITTEEKRVMISPFLVNPEDSVFLTIITSGKAPIFDAHARIAGVKGVNYVDSTLPAPRHVNFAIKLIAAFFMTTFYILYMASARRRMIVSRPLAYLTGLTHAAGLLFILGSAKSQIDALLPLPLEKTGFLILLVGTASFAALQITRRTGRAT